MSAQKSVTYWLSRDRASDGTVSLYVDVWLLRPEMRVGADGSYYYTLKQGYEALVKTGDGPKPAHYGTWTLDQCLRECRTYPDDHRQVIRNGHDEEPQLYQEDA